MMLVPLSIFRIKLKLARREIRDSQLLLPVAVSFVRGTAG